MEISIYFDLGIFYHRGLMFEFIFKIFKTSSLVSLHPRYHRKEYGRRQDNFKGWGGASTSTDIIDQYKIKTYMKTYYARGVHVHPPARQPGAHATDLSQKSQ